MTAIDPKKSPKRFDQAPRPKRLKPKSAPVSTLGDDAATVMLFYSIDEKTYRERLHQDFCRFCMQHGGWVISPPNQGRARVQIAQGSPLLEKLAALPRYPIAKLPNTPQHRLTHGRFVPVREIQVTLWRGN
jgi:hypothetical protein